MTPRYRVSTTTVYDGVPADEIERWLNGIAAQGFRLVKIDLRALPSDIVEYFVFTVWEQMERENPPPPPDDVDGLPRKGI